MKMKFTTFVVALLFACIGSCKGQVTGDNVKTAHLASTLPSQVMVEVNRKVHIEGLNRHNLAVFRRLYNEWIVRTNRFKWTFAGSGTVISDTWILTAAHLFNNLENPHHQIPGLPFIYVYNVNAVRVVVGTDRQDRNRHSHVVENVRIHRNYVGFGEGNDIALIQLRTPFTHNRRNMPLPPVDPRDRFAMDCKMVGWGLTDNMQEARFLK